MKHKTFKKHFSLFMLMAQSSIYKIFILFVFMIAIETALFSFTLSRLMTEYSFNIEEVVTESKIVWIFRLFLILLTVILCRTGADANGKQDYTFMRLSVSEYWVFIWQSIYNTICYLIFWMIQLLLVITFCYFYIHKQRFEIENTQMLFLTFYRSDFLHSLLPFEDILVWIQNLVFVLALGICSAHYPMAHRKGTQGLEIIAVAALTIGFFIRPFYIAFYTQTFGDRFYSVIAIAAAFVCIGLTITRLRKEVAYES